MDALLDALVHQQVVDLVGQRVNTGGGSFYGDSERGGDQWDVD